MTKVLITGATGNVGLEVIKALQHTNHGLEVYAGVRNPDNDRLKLADYELGFLKFDFMDIQTYKPALVCCDVLFLLRPPQISDVKAYFKPLISSCVEAGIKHIVFLSVQGVQNSSTIPHHKIEKLIIESNIPYTFLRPAYFMQNFTTTLREDLVRNQRIYLPAGNAKFTLIDVEDIGRVAAKVMANVSQHANTTYELTNAECLNFDEMADKLSTVLRKPIRFISPNLFSFYFAKRREKVPPMLVLVMIMLHYFPRFQVPPRVTDCVKRLTGQEPRSFEEFLEANRNKLE